MARVHPPTIAGGPQWSYRHPTRALADQGPLGADELNALGEDGWELPGIVADHGVVHYYLKRLVP